MAKDLEIAATPYNTDKLILGGYDVRNAPATLGYNNLTGGVVGPPDTRVADTLKRGTLVYWDTWGGSGSALIVAAGDHPMDGGASSPGAIRYGILATDVDIAIDGTTETQVYIGGEFNADVVFAEMEAVDAAPTDAQKALWMERLLIQGLILRTPV